MIGLSSHKKPDICNCFALWESILYNIACLLGRGRALQEGRMPEPLAPKPPFNFAKFNKQKTIDFVVTCRYHHGAAYGKKQA